VTVRVSDMAALRAHWHPVGPEEAFGVAPVPRTVLGTPVVLWRTEAGLHAAVDSCPHRRARLSAGRVCAGLLECPYHAWSFGPDGRAVHIPQLPAGAPVPPAARLQPVAVVARYGLVWLAFDPPVAPVPVLAEAADARYRRIFSFDQVWTAAAPWIADNAIDIAHVNVVHAATIGNADERRMAPYTVEPTEHGFVATMSLVVQGVAAQAGAAAERVERSMEVEVLGPFVTRVAIRYPSGIEHVLFIMACPIDDTTSRYLQVLARNDREEDVPAAALLEVDRAVVAEDRAICEGQPVDFDLDPRALVNLGVDRITVAYRHYLAALAAG
jgi:phenylpropionate dioxygenase-like ring-hydroxylating dioxygenase large terminal subunit